MGDHRASVKIEFSMYGLTRKTDFWINWGPDSAHPPIDDRVLQWFTESYEQFRDKHDEETGEADQRRRKAEEDRERAEYERLKEKFG